MYIKYILLFSKWNSDSFFVEVPFAKQYFSEIGTFNLLNKPYFLLD